MQNKKIIILSALFFSFVFSVFYYFLFTIALTPTSKETIVLYMNQLGLYEKTESVEAMMKRLEDADIKAYTFHKDGLQAVVSGVSREEKETQTNGEKLSDLKQNYIMKKVTIEDPKIVELIENHKIDEALEGLEK